MSDSNNITNCSDDANTLSSPPLPPTRPNQAIWENIFASFVEICSQSPTHLSPGEMSLATLDRIFISFAPSVFPNIVCNAGVIHDSVWCFTHGLSDHSPMFFNARARTKMRSEHLFLKREWCEHPDFENQVECLAKAAKINNLEVSDGLPLMKNIMRQAALHVRDKLLHDLPHSPGNVLLRLNSISRAVWHKDTHLANKLIVHSEIARNHVQIIGGVPCLIDAQLFEKALREAKNSYFARERKHLHDTLGSTLSGRSKMKGKLSYLNKKSALWAPAAPRIVLGGVKVDNATNPKTPDIQTSPQQIAQQLGSVWGKIFGGGEFDKLAADALLKQYSRSCKWEWDLCSPPTNADFTTFLAKGNRSNPGMDIFRIVRGETAVRLV